MNDGSFSTVISVWVVMPACAAISSHCKILLKQGCNMIDTSNGRFLRWECISLLFEAFSCSTFDSDRTSCVLLSSTTVAATEGSEFKLLSGSKSKLANRLTSTSAFFSDCLRQQMTHEAKSQFPKTYGLTFWIYDVSRWVFILEPQKLETVVVFTH